MHPYSGNFLGSSRGIGKTIVQRLAADGYHVAVNYRAQKEQADAVVDMIKKNGGEAFAIQANVADENAIHNMFEQVIEQYNRLDLLVNNTGWENIDHAIDMSLSDFRKAIDINLTATFLCSQQAARIMQSRDTGCIINNLSIHDETPRKGLAHYFSAKVGALMLTKCLALEWAEYEIRVNAVSSGAIETDTNRNEIEQFGRKKFDAMISLAGVGKLFPQTPTRTYLQIELDEAHRFDSINCWSLKAFKGFPRLEPDARKRARPVLSGKGICKDP